MYPNFGTYSRKGGPYDNACIESFQNKKKFIRSNTEIMRLLNYTCLNTLKVGTREEDYTAVLVNKRQMRFIKMLNSSSGIVSYLLSHFVYQYQMNKQVSYAYQHLSRTETLFKGENKNINIGTVGKC